MLCQTQHVDVQHPQRWVQIVIVNYKANVSVMRHVIVNLMSAKTQSTK